MKIKFSVVLIIFFFVSCTNRANKDNNNNENPPALQDFDKEIKSYDRSDDLVEELYNDLVETNEVLEKLENDFDNLSTTNYELQQKFDKYDRKSISYYATANSKISAISDSLLREKMKNHISLSKQKYADKISEHDTLIKVIAINESKLKDQHIILKILLTSPMIEKYQDDNIPNKNEWEDLIKQQEILIHRFDSLISKIKQ